MAYFVARRILDIFICREEETDVKEKYQKILNEIKTMSTFEKNKMKIKKNNSSM